MKKTASNVKTILFTGAVAVSLAACSSQPDGEQASAPQEAMKLPVDAIVVEEAPLIQEEVIVGTILPFREVEIVSELPRKIISTHFEDGAEVVQGQLLYKLDDTDLRAQLKRTEAELKLAQLNEERLSRLLKTETTTQQEYDEAVAKQSTLLADKELLQTQLAKTVIKAPFAGTAGISNVYPGAFVTPHKTLVSLQENRRVKLQFAVPEEYLPFIKKGTTVTFKTALDQTQHKAVITATEPGANVQNRTILVQAMAENRERQFRAGLSASVHFPVTHPGTKAVTIPTVALIPGAEGYTVFKIEKGAAKVSPVQVSSRSESEAVITAGLAAGDTLMVSNILRAMEGTPVQIVSSSFTSKE
ncbi:MAG: efflux RND transporter periplasmic adaptor subunit [Pontibacter sp.]|nr:efflux RND transporter periplasmic adaptor subunit [Pontibacter sp.]